MSSGRTAGSESRPYFSWSNVPAGITVVAVVAILYFAKDVLLPLAIALLLSFALAPIVSFLRRRGLPRIIAVGTSVFIAFCAIAMVAGLAAMQISTLASNIPTYQENVVSKVRSLRSEGGSGIVERLTRAVERVGAEIQSGVVPTESAEAEPQQKPLPVEVVGDQSALETLGNILIPLIGPFASLGLIVVVVIFMLLDRENLRDRFIRLVGYSDLHRTTEALEDAARRLGRYLLMQLVVNLLYAVPVTIGLLLIGIPNALLWGVLALVLRFVPYIGPAIAMILPMILALAVDPGWTMLLWTAALFLTLELISNNVIEPWLYGSQTGLSSVAVIVAAIFWTWLWGPLGLLLSTPLTVCLVVLGKYVPQFEFFEVLLGNTPVLPAEKRLYQRLLAGDADEATDHAEAYLQDDYLVDFYSEVGIPALLLAEEDRERGSLDDDRRSIVASIALELVENLKEIAEEEEEEDDNDRDATKSADKDAKSGAPEPAEDEDDLPDGEGRRLVCIGGRGDMDDAAAAMVAQVLEVQGAEARTEPHGALTARTVGNLNLEGVDTVVTTFLNANSLVQARQVVRRLKRARPKLRVGIFLPGRAIDEEEASSIAKTISADFVTATLSGAVIAGLAEAPAVRLAAQHPRIARRRTIPAKKPKPRQAKTAKAS